MNSSTFEGVAARYSTVFTRALACGLALIANLNGPGAKTMARKAHEAAQRALELDPNHPWVLFQVSQALGFVGDWAKAKQCAERSVELNPNIADARRVLATAYMRFDQPERAIEELDAEAILAPQGLMRHISLIYRAWAQFYAGRPAEALVTAEQALLHSPNLVYAFLAKTICYETLGHHEQARDSVYALIASDPSGTLEQYVGHLVGEAGFLPPRLRDQVRQTFESAWQAAHP